MLRLLRARLFAYAFASVLTATTFLTLSPTAIASGIPIGQDDNLEDLSAYNPPWFAELQDIELDGDLAYVFGVGGLAIFDISAPALPIELGRFEPAGHPYNRFYRGATNGTIACGGARSDGLSIMDVSDPSLPIQINLHGIRGQSYEGAEMTATHIYACRHSDGLEIVDITNPFNPQTTGTVTSLTNAWDIALTGNIAYVADGLGGLAVIGIDDPQAPVHVNSVPTSGSAVDVAVSGGLAFVCVGSAGVDVFDVSSPYLPTLVSTINTSGLAMTVGVAGDLIYVADWDDVESYDISNPLAPIQIGGEKTPVRAMGLAAREDLVVVADWSQLRFYRPGVSTRGDVHVSVEAINFGFVEVGTVVDTTFTVSNTGGAPLTITSLQEFNPYFQILTPYPIVLPVGGSTEIDLRFDHSAPGYQATFVRVNSDDSDEGILTFPISGDDDPIWLDVGNPAPNWVHIDQDAVVHQLSENLGRIVVMAFFANW